MSPVYMPRETRCDPYVEQAAKPNDEWTYKHQLQSQVKDCRPTVNY